MLIPLHFVCLLPIFLQHFIFILVYHILWSHVFHDVNVVIPLMIWVSIRYVAHAGVNALQPMIHFEILLQPSHWKVELMYRKRFPTFPPTIHRDEWILSSLEMVFKHWWMLSFVIANLIRTNLV